jgi:hypothetical protein
MLPRWICALSLVLTFTTTLPAAPPATTAPADVRPTREQAVAVLKPYTGETAANSIDRSTLTGKVMCGYQGWFTAPGDGSGKGWSHYPRRGRFEPGSCSIDLWPDVSELAPSERVATPFRHADGSVAYVFSSHGRATVLRHFRWMREYGIDGVFVQRFAVETFSPAALNHCNVVLDACREGANREGRAYAVMYDLSGLREGGIDRVIDDWKVLVDRMRVGRDDKDKAYLRHRGKPVVAVWGVGFNDGRRYTLADCAKLIDFLKNDPTYGGNTVMVGVPTFWRTLEADAVRDPALLDVIRKADVVSPWTVGRYTTPDAAASHAEKRWAPDAKWCAEHDKDYLPVVFPGFSWHNMNPAPNRPLDQIPRRKGQFLWSQFAAARRAGMTMIYVAMFDEMDEGTAIFKCTNDPPVGESSFLTFEGLPSDYYLWLTGMGGRLLRGGVELADAPPRRDGNPR